MRGPAPRPPRRPGRVSGESGSIFARGAGTRRAGGTSAAIDTVTDVTAAKVSGGFLRALEDFDATVGAELKPRLREMIRLRCSHINGCNHSVRLHSEQLSRLGERPEVIAALARPVTSMRRDLVSEGDAAALRFAEILTDYPRGLEADARATAGQFFTQVQLGAIVETVALVNAWNRVARGSE